MFFRKKKKDNNYINNIDQENIKELFFIKNNKLLITICMVLLIPLIYVITELMIHCSTVRLFTIIFGFSLITILITCIIMNLVSILFIRDNGSSDSSLEDIYLDKHKNNRKRNDLLNTSFIIFCSFFVVLIASIIVIMILA